MKKIIWIVIALLIVWGLVSLGSDKKTSGEAIRIGSVLGLTGFAEVDSLNIQRGIELAKKDLEEDGITVEIFYEDDQTESKDSISALRKLESINKPSAYIGFSWSFLLEAVDNTIDELKVPVYSPANSSEFVTNKSQYIFYGAIRNEHKVEPLTKLLKELGSKRAATVSETSGWGDNHRTLFKKAVDAAGGEVVLVEKIPYGSEVDIISTLVAKLKSENVDVLIWTHTDFGSAILLKRLQESGLDIPVIGTIHLENVVKKEQVVLDPETDVYVFKTPFSDDFVHKFVEEYNEPPGLYADSAYDGLMILVEAIVNADGSSDSIRDYIKDNLEYEGFAADYDFNENGEIIGGEWIIEKVKSL